MSLFVQQAAETDSLRQVGWYAERGLPHTARRFPIAVRDVMTALAAMASAGSPMHIANPHLAGVRTWPVEGFPGSHVCYLVMPDLLTIVRVLHGKRDIAALLEDQDVENTPPSA